MLCKSNLHFYCADILSGSQAQWRTKQISVKKPKSNILSKNSNRQLGVQALIKGKPNQKDVFKRLLKDAVEGADRTKRGSLFHRVEPQE